MTQNIKICYLYRIGCSFELSCSYISCVPTCYGMVKAAFDHYGTERLQSKHTATEQRGLESAFSQPFKCKSSIYPLFIFALILQLVR